MNPAFSLKVLQSFMPTFNVETKMLIQNLDSQVGQADFDLFPLTNFYSMRVVCGNIFLYSNHFEIAYAFELG